MRNTEATEREKHSSEIEKLRNIVEKYRGTRAGPLLFFENLRNIEQGSEAPLHYITLLHYFFCNTCSHRNTEIQLRYIEIMLRNTEIRIYVGSVATVQNHLLFSENGETPHQQHLGFKIYNVHYLAYTMYKYLFSTMSFSTYPCQL